MQHDVGTPFNWTLEAGTGERIVDNQRDAGAPRSLCGRGEIDQIERGISGCLDIHETRLGTNFRCERIGIVSEGKDEAGMLADFSRMIEERLSPIVA